MSERRKLDQRRFSRVFDLRFWNQPWAVTIGYFPDRKTPGEVFINAQKTPGTDLDSQARDGAILMSLCLQYGCPVEVMRSALTRNADGSPSAITGAIADQLLVE